MLVVGAGFIGVEWVTELEHFCHGLRLWICDFLPLPLGPLPERSAKYCKAYMERKKISQHYSTKYDPKDDGFWARIDLPEKADKQYNCLGIKASNYFMPPETLSKMGPGGGKWILMDSTLAVKTKSGEVWSKDEKGYPRIFAIGDCNFGAVEDQPPEGMEHGDNNPIDMSAKPPQAHATWRIPMIPKISYPGEEEGVVACHNIFNIEKLRKGENLHHFGGKVEVQSMHWPWGAGMFATSLGPDDACFVVGASFLPKSGYQVVWGQLCAVQKEIIEASKVDECAHGVIGRCIWHFVHHTPVHLWGGGPLWGY